MEAWQYLIVGLLGGGGGIGTLAKLYQLYRGGRQTELELAFKALVEASVQQREDFESVLEIERRNAEGNSRRCARLERSIEDQQVRASERLGRVMLLEAENANLREENANLRKQLGAPQT